MRSSNGYSKNGFGDEEFFCGGVEENVLSDGHDEECDGGMVDASGLPCDFVKWSKGIEVG